MREFLVRWLPGAEDTVEVLSLKIEFRFPVPGWLVVLLIIGLGVYCYQIYRREAPNLTRRMRWFLTVMRFITWVAVILAVLQPHIVLDRLIEPKSNLAILVDTSRSMTLIDKQASEDYLLQATRGAEGDGASKPATVTKEAKKAVTTTTRLDLLKRILDNDTLKLLPTLQQKYALRFFVFDKETRGFEPLPEPDEKADEKKTEATQGVTLPKAEGEVTQLGQALRDVAARLRGLPVAGIVAFTDGANNKGEDPEVVARRLGTQGIPVFPVGLGMPEAVDVKIVDVNIPDLVFKDDELAVKVTFEASALEGVSLPVKLMLGEAQVGEGDVEAREGVFSQEFVIRPRQKGDLVFQASVPPQINEYFTENNTLQKRVRVIDNAIRILIVCDTPSWEYRYLKGFLNSDTRIETKVFIRRGDLRRAKTDPQYLDVFPPYETLKREVDCLIMNNITADYFSNQQLKEISEYVSKEGGSLIMISSTKGTPGTFIGTPVGDLLPVTLRRVNEDPSLDLSPMFTHGFKLRLTREGRYHVIPRLTPKLEDNIRLWQTLPDQYWYYRGVERLKPAAVALVEHASARNEYGPVPIISIQRFGRGQVLFLAINSIWRWRYKIGNRMTNRFWGQTIQFMGLPHLLGTIKRVQFETMGHDFLVGESIPVTARVLTREYTPIQDESITLTASSADEGEEMEFTFTKDADKQGVFSGNLFLKEGTWNVRVVGYESEETLVLDIRPPRYEFEKPAMQKDVLDTVAEVSGGQFVRLDQLQKLPEWIGSTVKRSRARLERDLWDTWITLLLISITTGLEWLFRKMRDMP